MALYLCPHWKPGDCGCPLLSCYALRGTDGQVCELPKEAFSSLKEIAEEQYWKVEEVAP
jgi:hypothetical protein